MSNKHERELAGKVALVTGGSRGIGAAIAKRLAAEGASIALTYSKGADAAASVVEAIEHDGGKGVAIQADAADADAVRNAVETTVETFGRLDVLVNNAGIAGPTARVEDIRPEDWDRCIAVDLNGMFYCTRKAMPMIKAAGGGSIINLSSAAGRLAFPMRTPYSAAKWAVVGFTQSLAAEAGPEKVRVNCIQPGVVEGERIERVIEAKAKGLGVDKEEVRRRLLEGVSMHTTVTAQDIANMALFLATEAGRHISGQAISVCGGARYLV